MAFDGGRTRKQINQSCSEGQRQWAVGLQHWGELWGPSLLLFLRFYYKAPPHLYPKSAESDAIVCFFFFNENALLFILHENLQLCAPWDPDSVGKEHGVYSLSLNPQT